MTTNIELKESIDTNIINKTVPSSVTRANVGNSIKSIIDYIDQEINLIPTSEEKIYIAKLSQISSGGVTETVIKNTLSGEITVTFSVQSTGTYGISPSDLGSYECQVSNESLVKNIKAPMYFNGFLGVFKQTDLTGTLVDNFTDVYVRLKAI